MNYQIFYGYYIVIQIDKFFEATNIEQDEHRNHQEDQDDRHPFFLIFLLNFAFDDIRS
mgnify:CR=1 FL=1